MSDNRFSDTAGRLMYLHSRSSLRCSSARAATPACRELVRQLELLYLKQHGKPMHKATELVNERDCLDDEIRDLRESLKYAALVGELDK